MIGAKLFIFLVVQTFPFAALAGGSADFLQCFVSKMWYLEKVHHRGYGSPPHQGLQGLRGTPDADRGFCSGVEIRLERSAAGASEGTVNSVCRFDEAEKAKTARWQWDASDKSLRVFEDVSGGEVRFTVKCTTASPRFWLRIQQRAPTEDDEEYEYRSSR